MLKLENVYCSYDNLEVVKNFTFNINKKEILCIVGPNGGGKSTLLRAISNLTPFEGNILINSKNIEDFKRKDLSKKIALLTQNYNIQFPYTVYETVACGRYPYLEGAFSSLRKKDKLIIEESIKLVGLEEIKNKLINELSGGQLQRVFLARTFAQDPEIILLDEPTNHLDLKFQIELLNHLKNWCEKNNKIVIAVLHDFNLVYNFADKVILMKEGEKIIEGSPREVLNSTAIKDVYEIDIREFMVKNLENWKRG